MERGLGAAQQRCPFLSLCTANCPTAGGQKMNSLPLALYPAGRQGPVDFPVAPSQFEQPPWAQRCGRVPRGAPALGGTAKAGGSVRGGFPAKPNTRAVCCCCRPPKPAPSINPAPVLNQQVRWRPAKGEMLPPMEFNLFVELPPTEMELLAFFFVTALP